MDQADRIDLLMAGEVPRGDEAREAIFSNGMSPREWNAAGMPDVVERATARKKEILTTYYPDYTLEAIDDVLLAKRASSYDANHAPGRSEVV